jgi:nucleoside-diphosphate-sugar epimerase
MSANDQMRRAVVTGAGGFIGHHLTRFLRDRGHWVRGVDVKLPEFEPSAADEFELRDLRHPEECLAAVRGVDDVYHLAADMGGIGYITAFHAVVARNNVLIDANMLEAAREVRVRRFFYASSACVYPEYRQTDADVTPLREEDAYPADPEKGYGWEKLYAEQLCRYYLEDHGLETRVARFHNIFGPLGTFEGGREKAPAAICRKVALAANEDEIEVWGDGSQTRSFTYVDDCVQGIYRIAQSDHAEPLNLGSDELVTVDQLVDLVAEAAGKTIRKRHDRTRPQGVRGRNSDNGRLLAVLGWQPSTRLQDGIASTYRWIEAQLAGAGRLPALQAEEVRA